MESWGPFPETLPPAVGTEVTQKSLALCSWKLESTTKTHLWRYFAVEFSSERIF